MFGMVTDVQVRRLMRLRKSEKSLAIAASKAGMDEKTARKWAAGGKLPSQVGPERTWRTRPDPFGEVWGEVERILRRAPGVEAKAVFEYLNRETPGRFEEGQLRTLQRRIKVWKATEGLAKEVMFAQRHPPGAQCQSDFTRMGDLSVTIRREPLDHMLYHFVLTRSNWEDATVCHGESFESLTAGLQNALWRLGAVPAEHRTDSLSAAVNNLNEREEFTENYRGLMRHYGMKFSHTQAGRAHENGDVEQSHHRFKTSVEQELLLRGSRDFESAESYKSFLEALLSRRNAARRQSLAEELAVMRRLPERRLEDFTRLRVGVSAGSTIRVRKNTYSVDSRLIGETVDVRLHHAHLEVHYGQRIVESMPRLRGEGKHRIQYRHVIDSLVRKPGAFARYRYRADMFPGVLFRAAWDELRRECPATADRQYLEILLMAARRGERRVERALKRLVESGRPIREAAVLELLAEESPAPAWRVSVAPVDVASYDALLTAGTEVSR